MIDWLIKGDPGDMFVTTRDATLTYAELRAEMPAERGRVLSSIVPQCDLASVIAIFKGVASGPLRITSGDVWAGYTVDPDDMTILHTSGTTGKPKVVPLTEDNWKAAVEASASHLDHTSADEWLIAMPLHHVGGLSVLFRSAFVGGRIRMLPEFDAAEFADALSSGVTIASVVPTMLRRVLDHDQRSYEGLKAVLVGGGPIPEGILEEAVGRGLPVLPTYGMTETCGQVATLKPRSSLKYKVDLLPGVEARIDSDGRIALRGPQVFGGYLFSEKRHRDGWFVTGDLGEIDSDGRLRVLGRADDVIVTGGENVDPVRIETWARSVGGVDEVMVVGIPSSKWGSEIVCLYVGDVLPAGLEESARSALEDFEVPKRWVKVDAIPKSALGKPDRSVGRDLALKTYH